MIAHHIGPIASALVPNIASIVTPVALTIVNPGAESALTVGWTGVSAAVSSVATATNGSPRSGSKFFKAASVGGQVLEMTQTVAIPSSTNFGVDNFAYQLVLDAYLNCQITGANSSAVKILFLDGSGNIISGSITPKVQAGTQNTWVLNTTTIVVPPLTRSIKFTFSFYTSSGNTNAIYMDDIAANLVQVPNYPRIDAANNFIVMGNRVDALAIREAPTYYVLGPQQNRLGIRDAVAYYIITP
jgi:hypothetical protein